MEDIGKKDEKKKKSGGMFFTLITIFCIIKLDFATIIKLDSSAGVPRSLISSDLFLSIHSFYIIDSQLELLIYI